MGKLFGFKKNAKSELEMQVNQVLASDGWDSSSEECYNKVSELFTKDSKISSSSLEFVSCIIVFLIFYNMFPLIGFQPSLLIIPSIITPIILGNIVVTIFRFNQLKQFDKRTLNEWISKLMVKKSEVKSNNDLEKQKVFLNEKVNFLSNKRKILREFDSAVYLSQLMLSIHAALCIGKVLGFGILTLVGAVITGSLSLVWWQIRDFKKYDIPELAYYQKKLEAVETLLKRGDNLSLKTEKLSGTKEIKYSYKYGQAMNAHEARDTYDYQAIKTKQGYTKKRTITGVKSFK